MIQITTDPIETQPILDTVCSVRTGATVLFLGTTRQYTHGRETVDLEYECYREMAMKKMQQLHDRALEKWPIKLCSIVHRIGIVPLGEASVAIAVSTPHRLAAFEAAEWLIDTLKKEVPIWKKECYADGAKEWVHPD